LRELLIHLRSQQAAIVAELKSSQLMLETEMKKVRESGMKGLVPL
jgi:hypothetical protein